MSSGTVLVSFPEVLLQGGSTRTSHRFFGGVFLDKAGRDS